jgi:hypothetical protein
MTGVSFLFNMKLVLFKVKKEKLAQWVAWCHRVATEFKTEALETLREEKVSQEGFSLFSVHGDFYTLGYALGEPEPANTTRELNKLHKQMKRECLEFAGELETLYNLSAE